MWLFLLSLALPADACALLNKAQSRSWPGGWMMTVEVLGDANPFAQVDMTLPSVSMVVTQVSHAAKVTAGRFWIAMFIALILVVPNLCTSFVSSSSDSSPLEMAQFLVCDFTRARLWSFGLCVLGVSSGSWER